MIVRRVTVGTRSWRAGNRSPAPYCNLPSKAPISIHTCTQIRPRFQSAASTSSAHLLLGAVLGKKNNMRLLYARITKHIHLASVNFFRFVSLIRGKKSVNFRHRLPLISSWSTSLGDKWLWLNQRDAPVAPCKRGRPKVHDMGLATATRKFLLRQN